MTSDSYTPVGYLILTSSEYFVLAHITGLSIYVSNTLWVKTWWVLNLLLYVRGTDIKSHLWIVLWIFLRIALSKAERFALERSNRC